MDLEKDLGLPNQLGGHSGDPTGADGGGLPSDDGGGLPSDDNLGSRADSDPHEQIRRLEEKLDRNERFMQTLLQQQNTQGAHGNAPEPPEEYAGLNPDDLPDPVEKPSEFRAALAEHDRKTREYFERQQQNALGQMNRAQSLNQVWSKFQSEHADLAKRTALVNAATSVELQELQREGISDVESYILSDPDQFNRRVAERMKRELGLDSGSDDGDASQHNQVRREPPPSNRTKGVGGGSRQQISGKGGDDTTKSFTDQLKTSQLENGLM